MNLHKLRDPYGTVIKPNTTNNLFLFHQICFETLRGYVQARTYRDTLNIFIITYKHYHADSTDSLSKRRADLTS